jgi:Rieske Fe-S protein
MPQVPTRREFCAYACQTASVIAVGAATACGGSPTSPSTSAPPLSTVSGSVTGRTISVTVDAASPLAAVGSAATVQTGLGSFLIARLAQDAFSALTAICTHEACTITGFAAPQYVCPCHGSRYTTTGVVATGPATRALTSYTTQFANGVLTFTV